MPPPSSLRLSFACIDVRAYWLWSSIRLLLSLQALLSETFWPRVLRVFSELQQAQIASLLPAAACFSTLLGCSWPRLGKWRRVQGQKARLCVCSICLIYWQSWCDFAPQLWRCLTPHLLKIVSFIFSPLYHRIWYGLGVTEESSEGRIYLSAAWVRKQGAGDICSSTPLLQGRLQRFCACAFPHHPCNRDALSLPYPFHEPSHAGMRAGKMFIRQMESDIEEEYVCVHVYVDVRICGGERGSCFLFTENVYIL